MAYRVFTGQDGRAWTVWVVLPSPRDRGTRLDPNAAPRESLGPEYARGWLAFVTRAERRRLAPIPIGWEEMTVAGLERLCRVASVVRRSRRDRFRNMDRQPNEIGSELSRDLRPRREHEAAITRDTSNEVAVDV